jgi:hypothetical protein
MARVTKDLFPRCDVRRASDRSLIRRQTFLIMFWFCVAMFLLGVVCREENFHTPFDIWLEGSGNG